MQATRAEMDRAGRWLAERLAAPAAAASFSFLVDERRSGEILPGWTVAPSSRNTATRGQREHTLVFHDPGTGLEARWVAVEFEGSSAIEATLYLRNRAGHDSPVLADVLPLDALLPCVAGRCVIHYSRGAQTGRDDFAPASRVMAAPTSTLRLTAGGGRSSSEHLPFFCVETGNTGVVLGIGWTGEWAARFTREGESLRVEAGMDRTRFRLRPGEEIRSPLVALVFWEGDPLRGHNLLRSFILEHHTPRVGGAPLSIPVLSPSWGSTPFEIHEKNIRSIITRDLPVDVYWVDAEWFGASPWWRNTGSWTVRRDVYPHGLRPLADLLHASGRKLLVWFEPHRVSPGTAWQREHEEWLLRVPPGAECRSWPHWVDLDDPAWRRDESNRNQIADGDALLNIGIPEARRFLTEAISGIISESGIDGYREDFNIAPLSFWRAADEPDRQGITEIRWVEGLYAFWDELRERHPGLIIDNCASGGRRIDLETMSRAIPFWRTDFPCDPVAAQAHTLGLLPWVPLNAVGKAMIGDEDPYRLRSYMASSLLAFFANKPDAPDPDPVPESFPFELARRNLEAYRAIHRFYTGDFYPLTGYSLSNDAWAAYQLDRPDLGEGIVLAFRRPASPFEAARFALHGIDRGASCEVRDMDTGEARTVTGAQLAAPGLPVAIEARPGSKLYHYRRSEGMRRSASPPGMRRSASPPGMRRSASPR
jgi:alpha-galactosidase